jgi:hypothetical protein
VLEEQMEDEECSQLPQCPQYGGGFLYCWALMVANPVPIVANMYSKKKDSMTISLSVHCGTKRPTPWPY